MGRPKTFDEDVALSAAMAVFWRDGFHGATLESLLSATGLSKSSLYQTFGSKHDLFLRCFDQYRRNMVGDLMTALARAESPREFIHDFLLSTIEEATPDQRPRKGCLIVNSAHELSQKDPIVAAAVAEGAGHIASVLRRAVEQGRVAGDITATTPTDTVVGYIMTAVCGLRTMVMAGVDASELKPVVALTMQALE